MKIRFALAAAATVALSACSIGSIENGTVISQADAASIQIGKTTKQQIYLNFGEPTRTEPGGKVAFYSWTKGSKFKVLGIGSANARGNTLVVIFDENDVVKDYRITRGAAGASVVN
jgi:outer membrane protein assembly factor BamE (lipoprotein component of BamABCDE complex)